MGKAAPRIPGTQKVGFLELHFISQQVPYADERSIPVEFSRVISKWVTWALVGGGREH
jgi:hypothetical protein